MRFDCLCLSCVTEAVAERRWGTSGQRLTQPVAPIRGWAPVLCKDQTWPFLVWLVFCWFFFFPLVFFLQSLPLRWAGGEILSFLDFAIQLMCACLHPTRLMTAAWAWTLTLGCVSVHSMRCQSILHMAMFRYKKDTAIKYSRILNDHFKVGHAYY